MKRSLVVLALAAMCAALLPAHLHAATLGTAASTVIPSETQQIISVDYRRMNNAPSALALKKKLMPDAMKQFEQALKGVGINPETDVDTLDFAAFRIGKQGLHGIGIAQGNFSRTKVLKQLKLKKIKGDKHGSGWMYPMAGGLDMSFLDANTLLFGERTAVEYALDVRDGTQQSLSSNNQMSDLVANVGGGTIWSVLDTTGTNYMLRQALGDASKLADYDTVKKRIGGSYYTADFDHGVDFDLTVLTSDSMTATTLSSLIKAGMLYRKMSAQTSAEKTALEATSVDSDSEKLTLKFTADDKRFQSLLNSDLFAAVSH
jgi:hypothetical protein